MTLLSGKPSLPNPKKMNTLPPSVENCIRVVEENLSACHDEGVTMNDQKDNMTKPAIAYRKVFPDDFSPKCFQFGMDEFNTQDDFIKTIVKKGDGPMATVESNVRCKY
jgi:hypothetical protein